MKNSNKAWFKVSLLVITVMILQMALGGCAPKPVEPGTNEPNQGSGQPDPETPQSEPMDPALIGAVFAIADESGERLITFTQSETTVDEAKLDAAKRDAAIGKDGAYLEIQFKEVQMASDQDTGRITAANFDQMAGDVYDVTSGTAVPNQTYFLCSSDLIPKASLLQSNSTGIVELDQAALSAITTAKGRTAQQGWILDEYSDGSRVLSIVFEPQGKNLLMSMALEKNGVYKFMDYPAVLDSNSAWRVDDGGSFDPALLSILFALPTKEGVVFTLSWIGAEGEVTYFLIESGDKLEEMPTSAYRYWSPA